METKQEEEDADSDADAVIRVVSTKKKQKIKTRNINLLEVGAINTELIVAAAKTQQFMQQTKSSSSTSMESSSPPSSSPSSCRQVMVERSLYQLDVRAIDLRSSHEQIEEADFLQIPVPRLNSLRYDVIVCSMVLNCVTTPQDRGKMLALLFHQLRPGGYCFLTIPRLCLSQSKYITKKIFNEMLVGSLGFEIFKTKESPKVSFWVLKRPDALPIEKEENVNKVADKFQKISIIHRGKKFKNMFSVILKETEVSGKAFERS
uniref:Uncharacterized protein n=1 Tax=Eucampia antarctica TaxID=49252 RepID=A0A7S2RBG4_9STRA